MEFDREYRRLMLEFSEGAIRNIVKKFQNDATEQEIRRELQDFEKYKGGLQKKDPFQYKSWIEFTEAIHAAKGKAEFKNKKAPTKDVVANQDDIVADDENVTIYRADSQDKCVLYGKGYSFCISRPGGGNMFTNYRFNDMATFYFIYFKKKPKTAIDHIMVLDRNRRGYDWTFADNNTKSVKGGWNEIVRKYPELTKYEKLLVNKELDNVEKDFLERKRNFQKQLPSYTNDPNVDFDKAVLLWNKFSHKEKAGILADYYDYTLHDVIWKQLDSGLRNEYININPDLSDYQMDDLKPNEILRYKKVRDTLFEDEYPDSYPEFSANKLDDIENVLKHPFFAMTYMMSWKNDLENVPYEVYELLADDPDLALEYAEWVVENAPNTMIPADIYESIMESGYGGDISDELRKYFGKRGYFGEDWEDADHIEESFQFNKQYRRLMEAYNKDVSKYKEIEFVCANPEFPDATDPEIQKQMYFMLKQIPGVLPLFQDQSEYSEGQYSLSAIYKDRSSRSQILKIAKQLGVKVDLEQSVSDDYVDRAIRGDHYGQMDMNESFQFDNEYRKILSNFK